jgi:hypothetical protein
MDTATILAELEGERDRLDTALAALRGRNERRLTLSGKPDGQRRKGSGSSEDGSSYEEEVGRADEAGSI